MSRDGWLPPGVEHGDIPGNRPEDAEWEDRLARLYARAEPCPVHGPAEAGSAEAIEDEGDHGLAVYCGRPGDLTRGGREGVCGEVLACESCSCAECRGDA